MVPDDAIDESDPRIQAALAELQGLILTGYPMATFTVGRGDDPEGVYLTATVDIEDVEEVIDVVVDRLVDLQVEEGLPVDVVPLEPLARVLAGMREREEAAHAARTVPIAG